MYDPGEIVNYQKVCTLRWVV